MSIEYHKGFVVISHCKADADTKKAQIDKGDKRGFIYIGDDEKLDAFCKQFCIKREDILGLPLWFTII